MSNFDRTPTYHGTSDQYASELMAGRVDTSKGGGELGQGFYLGTALHVAKAWAKQMHDCEAVVEFQIDDNDFWSFEILSLNEIETIEHRSFIRAEGKTRSFKFNKDVIWGPIVGGPKVYSDQHKWESRKGGAFLNGSSVLRIKR
ncbi:hypothetical protein FF32_01285 [Halomonas campaniensis]|nr:hypothetical protein FF32_01285 [Halomonas campaniensis]